MGRTLSIRPHNFVWNEVEVRTRKSSIAQSVKDEKRIVVYLSYFTEIHIGKFEEFESLKK